MGIPSFSRWLYQKYPKTIVPVVDHAILSPEGKIVLPDTTEPNPNKTEFDNLYIDMNGLIHPCCHPEDGPAPKDEDAMLENINDYFLYIFSLVRPRKILYLALDGVAPRAKMNQQRSRRFLSDKERNDERALNQRIAEKWKQDGRRIPENALKTSWDHNVITPGTPFMQKVSRSLKKLIRKLLAEDRSWKNLKVLYSDSSVPGEGEHKIMQFIRTVRLTPGYDPNSRHCVHGLDADLFMLALATHEPHFSLLRESVISPSVKSFESVSCEHCGSKSHATENCHVNKALRKNPKASISPKKFQFAHIWILREYLSEELRVQSFEGWDLERAVDDFVFLCFFVGNDFLPHLPSLSIREGSIDLLMSLYTKEFAEIGYLTSHGDINFRGVSFLLSKIGQLEDAVFKKRIEEKKYFKNQEKHKKQTEKMFTSGKPPRETNQKKANQMLQTQTRRQVLEEIESIKSKQKNKKSKSVKFGEIESGGITEINLDKILNNTDNEKSVKSSKKEIVKKNLIQMIKDKLTEKINSILNSSKNKKNLTTKNNKKNLTTENKKKNLTTEKNNKKNLTIKNNKKNLTTEKYKNLFENNEKQAKNLAIKKDPTLQDVEEDLKNLQSDKNSAKQDNVELGRNGWKERYYSTKFGCRFDKKFSLTNPPPQLAELLSSYLRGLQWVLNYYFKGCPSWGWFYPFHYAPFASDLARVKNWDNSFSIGKPLDPFAQLLGVMPPGSSHCLPRKLAGLMTDPSSDVADFYPTSVDFDLNGKRFLWQAVALLPFVDEMRLLRTIAPILPTLTEKELSLNKMGETFVFAREHQPLVQRVRALNGVVSNVKNGFVEKENDFVEKENNFVEKENNFVEKENNFVEKENGFVEKENNFVEKENDLEIEKTKMVKNFVTIEFCFGQLLAGKFCERFSQNGVVCFSYKNPVVVTKKRSVLLRKVKMPIRSLSKIDHSMVLNKRRFGQFRTSHQLRYATEEIKKRFSKYDSNFRPNFNPVPRNFEIEERSDYRYRAVNRREESFNFRNESGRIKRIENGQRMIRGIRRKNFDNLFCSKKPRRFK